MKFLIAALLVGHALIHVSYLTPAPAATAGGPAWPFTLTSSWLVTGLGINPDAVASMGRLLVGATVIALVLAAIATIGLLPVAWWPSLAATGAGLSLATLLLFFHPWLVLGIVIDGLLLWAILVVGWSPSAAAP